MSYQMTKKQKAYIPVKRFLDIIICLPVCIVLAPFMLIFAIAIKIDSPGPILFKQKRVGKNKEFFEIWKFRTMRTDTPKDMPTHMLSNPEAFITRTGKVYRKLSIDSDLSVLIYKSFVLSRSETSTMESRRFDCRER